MNDNKLVFIPWIRSVDGPSRETLNHQSFLETGVAANLSQLEQFHSFPERSFTFPSEDVVSVPFSRTCRVAMCPNPHCGLESHRLYDAQLHSRLSRDQASHINPLAEIRFYQTVERVEREGVDGLAGLPFGISQDYNLKMLFHHFFNSTFDRLASIFRGPQIVPNFRQRMLAIATTNEAYTMGLICQALSDIAIKRADFQETRYSLKVHTRTLKAFRKQLAVADATQHPLTIELALLVICNILCYDNVYARSRSLETHWAGLRNLVRLRGGIHRVTVSLPYVLHVDRQSANMLNQLPTYLSSPIPTLQIPRPSWSKYGSGFVARLTELTTGPQKFDPRILEYCVSSCGLLELYEMFESPEESKDAYLRSFTSAEYLYYSRDRIDEQFAILHVAVSNLWSANSCILWATRIIEYTITWRNNIPTFVMHLCNLLYRALRQQDLPKTWAGNMDVLIWILFVLGVSTWPYEGRPWAMGCLKSLLGARYGADGWPDDWPARELQNVKRYAWSEGNLDNAFKNACQCLGEEIVEDIVDESAVDGGSESEAKDESFEI